MTPETASNLLLRIAKDADEAAFNELYGHYAPRIKAYMMREDADDAAADDLAQQAMAVIWRKAYLFDPAKGAANAWIFRVARNLRIDRLRRERVWQALPEDHKEQPSNDPKPDDVLMSNQRNQALWEAVQTLPPEQLQVIELCYLSGLSQSEAARHLSLPLGTVKSRLRLAYAKLRPLLENTL
ncbi:MAG: sigma-70 family RNA polymerase sigma factor [Pseudomonadota bacterium]